jgi:nicotinate-nucleotide adenylyltransferase
VMLSTRRVDVSSTEIRARLRAGQSIRGFVPEAVADFIRSVRLYR